jgi:hypothetical protein
MFYFEHYLFAAGLHRLGRAVLLRTTDEAWVYEDLRAEIRDVFPEAEVTVAEPSEAPAHADLVVLPVVAPYEFPFHDVIYERLHELERLRPFVGRADYFMVYRALWREVEVFASSRFAARLRKRRWEGALIRACRTSPLLRRLLRPHYPS